MEYLSVLRERGMLRLMPSWVIYVGFVCYSQKKGLGESAREYMESSCCSKERFGDLMEGTGSGNDAKRKSKEGLKKGGGIAN
jgi:hypothetical protein